MSYTPDALDAKWRQLVEESDDLAVSMEAKLQRAAEEYETCLAELRDHARIKLAEK